MSEQHQAGPDRTHAGNRPQHFTTLEASGNARSALLLAMAWLAGSAGLLVSCSNDNGRGPNSEMRVDAPDAAVETKVPAREETARADNETPAAAPTGVGRKYRVAVETAYFFDKPEQSTPNGRYLRRGDAFFGEGETNGFVKTGFVQPNGSAGTAWLKLQGLSRLDDGPVVRPVRRKAPASTAQSADDGLYSGESSQPGPRQTPSAAPLSGAATAVVQAGRAYFYNSPDLAIPRKAYCERGDRVRLGEARGAAVYVTFTNWEKVTTVGWMKKAALGVVNP